MSRMRQRPEAPVPVILRPSWHVQHGLDACTCLFIVLPILTGKVTQNDRSTSLCILPGVSTLWQVQSTCLLTGGVCALVLSRHFGNLRKSACNYMGT